MQTTRPNNVPEHATPTNNPDGSISWKWQDEEGYNTYTTNTPPTGPIYHDPRGPIPIPPRKATARKLTFYTDPGHGWLAVDRADLDALGIAHRVTPYSYQRGNRVYLEEDCDATTYLEAAAAAGWRVTIREKYSPDSTIRKLRPYSRHITPAALINAAQQFGKLHIVHIGGQA